MKLLPLPISRSVFVDLHQAVDNVEVALSEVANLSPLLVQSKKVLIKEDDKRPADAEKLAEWHEKREQRHVEVRYHIYAMEDALGALEASINVLSERVEQGRRVSYAIAAQVGPLHLQGRPEEEVFDRAAVNVLLADRLRWQAAARLVAERDTVYQFPNGTDGCLFSGLLQRVLLWNKRDFTVRYRAHDSSWSYVQSEHRQETAATPPALPAMSERQADIVHARLVKHFAQSCPGQTIEVERYDVSYHRAD